MSSTFQRIFVIFQVKKQKFAVVDNPSSVPWTPFFAFVSIIKKLTIPCNKNENFHMVPPIKKPKKKFTVALFTLKTKKMSKFFGGLRPPNPP